MARSRRKITIGDGVAITQPQMENLQQAIENRMLAGKQLRDSTASIYEYIDREYYAYLLRDAEDQKRLRDATAGTSVKPVDEKLSLIFAQIDEAATYLLSVLAPDSGIYSAIAPREHQKRADGFAALLNRQARFFHHYDNYSMFLIDCLRYNLGAYGVFWKEHFGNVVNNARAGSDPVIREQLIEAGNLIETYDPYNLGMDPAVNPVIMAEAGEFFWTSHVYTRFRMQWMQQKGELLNVKDYIDAHPETKYYYTHPEVRAELPLMDAAFDWVKLFRGGPGSDQGIYEVNRLFWWVRPSEYGLGPSDEYQIWRFLVGAEHEIFHAKPLDNAHGFLPINVAVPFNDHANWNTKSMAERLIPYNRFASFMMNVHQRAARKNLYGLTFLDRGTFGALAGDKENPDLVGGVYFGNLNGQDADMRKRVVQFTDAPDTSNTLGQIEAMDSLMQKILPTNILQQVAGLDRATQYQAAATVQGANRRNLKIAKLITSQAMDRGRLMMMYNVFQYQQDVEIITAEGALEKVSVRDLREAKIEFTIDDGLKGIDRLSLQLNMKEMIAMILQSQQAAQQTDVMALIDHLSTLFGDFTDFNQFKLQSPLDQLPVELRNQAFQLLQQAMAAQEAQRGGGQPGVPAA